MIVYNVTVNVDDIVHDEWLEWMRTKHIPDVMATGCFVENKLMKILHDDPQVKGTTYAFHYLLNSMADYQNYVDNYAAQLRNDTVAKYGNHAHAFRTLLEVID